MRIEVTFEEAERTGVVLQIGEEFPTDEAPTGTLLVHLIEPLMRDGEQVGWIVEGHG